MAFQIYSAIARCKIQEPDYAEHCRYAMANDLTSSTSRVSETWQTSTAQNMRGPWGLREVAGDVCCVDVPDPAVLSVPSLPTNGHAAV